MIDTHAHLEKEFYNNEEIKNAIDNARNNGIKLIINSGNDINSSKEVIKVAEENSDIMRVTIGIHPNAVNDSFESDLNELKKLINHPLVIGVGECGLDYFRSSNKQEQINAFRKQLDLAAEYQLPAVIHSRDARVDVYNILSEYELTGIIHCFAGSLEEAKQFIELGYYIGIGGVVTFKNSDLKEIVKELDLNYITLETDAPFLSPVPFRGEKNEPARIKEIAEFIGEIKGISASEVSEITNNNVLRIFDKIGDL